MPGILNEAKAVRVQMAIGDELGMSGRYGVVYGSEKGSCSLKRSALSTGLRVDRLESSSRGR